MRSLLQLAAAWSLGNFRGSSFGGEAARSCNDGAQEECIEQEDQETEEQRFSLLQRPIPREARLDQEEQKTVETGGKSATRGSCASYGCGVFLPGKPCQCTEACYTYHNCCPDYQAACSQSAHGGSGSSSGIPKADTVPCPDKESCLRIVDSFLDRQPRNPNGLLQTYGSNGHIGGGGSCGWECQLPAQCPGADVLHHCRFDTYDSSLAAIYYTKRGRLAEAQRILDGFIGLLYPGKEVKFNGKKVSYGAADGLPSRRWLTLLAAAYTPQKAKPGDYWGGAVTDGAVDVGNNAWAAIAFAQYAADAGKPCYAVVAHDILAAIRKANSNCNDFLKGFTARLDPFPKYYRSTEHNIDMYALATMLGDKDSQWRAGTFVKMMYGYSGDRSENNVYSTGTDLMRLCDTGKTTNRIPVDAQTWNLLANADDVADRKRSSIAQTLKKSTDGGALEANKDLIGNGRGGGKGDTYVGFRFSTRGNGAQWENSASGVMSLIHYRSKYGEMIGGRNVSYDIEQVGKSLRGLLQNYGSMLASALGGNSKAWQKHPGNGARNVPYPGGSDTGFEWTYLRYPHTAATAWTGYFLLMQADASQPLNPHANPYAPPARPVPDKATAAAAAGQCIDGHPQYAPGPAPPASGPLPQTADKGCSLWGCGDYNPHHFCQCNSRCHQFGNCCVDYASVCESGNAPAAAPPPAPLPSSSAGRCSTYGCNRYLPGKPCQCTEECHRYHNCCSDYQSVCRAASHGGGSSAACSAHPGCRGLGGNCCPAPGGMYLGCCR
mmetsp:Transcript_97416/g.275494  ORF Transcript_97416/g.275494 Transcript_97416/m.275494 type:complete len:775 (-) Transcript_97416:83-2407(-)